MNSRVAALQAMKREGRKIAAIVAWDAPTAALAERAGADFISVGDSVGVNLWGRTEDEPVTLEEILLVCGAVRRGAQRCAVSCDIPAGVAHGSPTAAAAGEVEHPLVEAALRIKDAGADMVKVLAFPKTVRAITDAGVPVFAEFHGDNVSPEGFVTVAKRYEAAGAVMLDFRHSGPVAGPAVVSAVSIPVLGGMGGGPWLDGRVRLAQTAAGYGVKWLDAKTDTYANTAKATLEAFQALVADVREGRQIKG